MARSWMHLPEAEVRVFKSTVAFMEGRLAESQTLDWALRLTDRDLAKRLGVLEVLTRTQNDETPEPWLSAWRLIEESWSGAGVTRDHSSTRFEIARRIAIGERSGALVSRIVDTVRPALGVAPLSKLDLSYRRQRRSPRSVRDLMSVQLNSGEVVDPSELSLDGVSDVPFLLELAHDLEAAVVKGLDIGDRLFGASENRIWRLGDLRRVYFVPPAEQRIEEHEPDEFNTGIAPAVKLLYAVVLRLHDVNSIPALAIIHRWGATSTSVHTRLWAAFARDSLVASAGEVEQFFKKAGDRVFWDLNQYPEVAELRARRFSDMTLSTQDLIARRLRRGPPANHWPRSAPRERVREAQRYSTLREMRRIEIAGAMFSDLNRKWLVDQIGAFGDLVSMSRVDDGFLGTSRAMSVESHPDERYDVIVGTARLEALEAALTSPRAGWDDDPARSASAWLSAPNNSRQLIADFESTESIGKFPQVWNRFGWSNSPSPQSEPSKTDDLKPESVVERVLSLLERLPLNAARDAIQGLSYWLDSWAKSAFDRPLLVRVWLRLWPLAVEATNSEQEPDTEPSLNVVVQGSRREEPQDLDTLNTPAGRFVGVFLLLCPTVKAQGRPFDDPVLAEMRETALRAPGRAGLVVHHRLIEQIAYFLQADPTWTREKLIAPLLEDTQQAIVLWRAIARRTRFKDVLSSIGEPMADRAVDPRLGRDSRRSLAFSIVIETLHALREDREPAVPIPKVQQMLRLLDGEVLAYAANSVRRFVHDLSLPKSTVSEPASPELIFQKSGRPFLERIWPQERSLASPGVSRAFANLPSTCRDSFADAVNSIERFLVPFDCWSMLDFGLYGEAGGKDRILTINTPEKGEALLRLLNLTIGTAEAAIVPSDLGAALDQVGRVAPRLVDSQPYRRLAALARR